MAWNDGLPIQHAGGKNDPAHNYVVENGQQDGWNVHIHKYQDGHTEIVRVSPIATPADPAPAAPPVPVAVAGAPQPAAPPPSNPNWADGPVYTNNDPNNPRYGEQYYVVKADHDGHAGEWHIYKDGTKVFESYKPENMTLAGNGGVAAPTATGGQSQGTVTIPHDQHSGGHSGGSQEPQGWGVHFGHPQGWTGSQTEPHDSQEHHAQGNGGVAAPSDSQPASTTPQFTQPFNPWEEAHKMQQQSGGGSTATLDVNIKPETSGSSYTVVHGDTMWGIAKAHNISLAQLEELNPQIKHPEMIMPGDKINLGSGAPHEVGAVVSPTITGQTGSTYPMLEQNKPPVAHADKVAGGWGAGTTPADPANQVIALEEPSTDPLKIKDDKSNHSEHVA